MRGRNIPGILHFDGERLQFGMAHELAADQLPEPRPVAHRAAGGMKPHKPAPGPDITLKRRLLLFGVENLIIDVVEDQRPVPFQVLIGEHRRVIRDIHGEVMRGAELLNRRGARREVVVDISLAVFGINQHPAFRGRARQAGGQEHQQAQHDSPYPEAKHGIHKQLPQ